MLVLDNPDVKMCDPYGTAVATASAVATAAFVATAAAVSAASLLPSAAISFIYSH